MTVRTEDKREVHIENHRLDQKICQDLKKYDILFIQAPIGWGKHTYLADFSVAHPEYDISFLKRARELCSEYDVLLIFDEVATGFGRTGYRFVADEVLPDILVLGKALTGGYMGHAVTVANQKVFNAFYSDDDRKALMHGPTFMGNPLACAVALKGIEIFEREDYMSKIHRITEISHREMDGFTDPRIREVRIMGGCTCVDVYDPSTLEGFQQFAYERGVFSRPFLTCMYTMMPYIIKEEELIQIYDVMKEWFRR